MRSSETVATAPSQRRHRWRALVILAASLIGGAVAVHGGPAVAESNGGVRVMPLGDSITEGTQVPGGYRIGLWQRLVAGNYKVDFVGSQSNGPSNLGDHDHEGHPGWRIDQIDANINGWLQSSTPRTILLHIGTNDVLQNYNLSGAPSRLSTLIDHITAADPSADVFVATIIPLASSSQESAARTFNAAVPGIVQSKASAGKHVHLVDMHSALTAADLTDGIHPTASGYDKMAATWYNALLAVPGSIGSPGGTTTPPTPPSDTPPTTSSPTPPAGGTCSATYAVTGQWAGGFQGAVTVTAGSRALSSWTVTWQWHDGQTISQAWNATITASGSAVTARNVSYNGSLAPGAAAQFGFLGSWQTANGTPTLACSGT